MEDPGAITLLNDFIFCPVSIYFHSLDYETDRMVYQSPLKLNGSAAHEKSDTGRYSDRKDMFQGTPVYCLYIQIKAKL